VTTLVFDHLGLIDYAQAWDEQRRRQAARAADETPDTVLLLEHPPVYTAGKRTLDLERPVDGMWTAAARSPGTGPASSWATRS